jgi:hypothetical protein
LKKRLKTTKLLVNLVCDNAAVFMGEKPLLALVVCFSLSAVAQKAQKVNDYSHYLALMRMYGINCAKASNKAKCAVLIEIMSLVEKIERECEKRDAA